MYWVRHGPWDKGWHSELRTHCLPTQQVRIRNLRGNSSSISPLHRAQQTQDTQAWAFYISKNSRLLVLLFEPTATNDVNSALQPLPGQVFYLLPSRPAPKCPPGPMLCAPFWQRFTLQPELLIREGSNLFLNPEISVNILHSQDVVSLINRPILWLVFIDIGSN